MKLIGLTIFAAATNAGKYKELAWVQGLSFRYGRNRKVARKNRLKPLFRGIPIIRT